MENSAHDRCTVTAITTGVVSATTTTLVVACMSLTIQIAVYQCVYKPRLRSFTATASGRGHSLQREDATGYVDSVAYDVVGERCMETTMEMKRNDAYFVGERVGGLALKQNEAYGVARST